jgi:hypothetical protein
VAFVQVIEMTLCDEPLRFGNATAVRVDDLDEVSMSR